MARKKYSIVYHSGTPNGIRSIHHHILSITTYIVPRRLLTQARQITGINRPGIYYLVSESERDRLYIGQTRNGVSRLDDHNRSKDFWDTAILFLADRNTFTLDIISGLEKHAIVKAFNSNRYKIDNVAKPKYKVDEYDVSLIDEIFEEIEFILATLGYKMDEPVKVEMQATGKKFKSNPTIDSQATSGQVFETTTNGILAYGTYNGESFEVLKDSEVDMSHECRSNTINAIRKNSITNGSIKNINGKYILTKSLQFNSPSSAAGFVLGGSRNGWIEWKNQEGKTLDEICRNK